jgi:signal-transduction protein with cAMP-binding, CBS, and nucleotidyltransferase domain
MPWHCSMSLWQTVDWYGLDSEGVAATYARIAFGRDLGLVSGDRYRMPVQLAEIMTAGVVTAMPEASAISVARQMRDNRVGSVVIVDPAGSPVAMVTDRDLTVRVFADGVDPEAPVGDHASRPLICGEPAMELDEAAALMVQHRVRRLPVVDGGSLVGIVTLDDIAVRTGNLEVAQRMTAEVIEGALPQFYFHERG